MDVQEAGGGASRMFNSPVGIVLKAEPGNKLDTTNSWRAGRGPENRDRKRGVWGGGLRQGNLPSKKELAERLCRAVENGPSAVMGS